MTATGNSSDRANQPRKPSQDRRSEPRSVSLARAVFRGRQAASILNLRGERRRRFLLIVVPRYRGWVRRRKDVDPRQQGLPRAVPFSAIIARLEKSFVGLGLDLFQLRCVLEVMAPELYCSGAPDGTQAAPGSRKKIRVLRRRAARRLDLFGPDDAG